MTLKTANEFFSQALSIAEQERDPYREAIAAGLVDLTEALQLRTTQLKSDLEAIKNKIH